MIVVGGIASDVSGMSLVEPAAEVTAFFNYFEQVMLLIARQFVKVLQI